MSAFLVTGTHLAAIIGSCAAFDPISRIDVLDAGRVLAAENARSVEHRYGQPCEPVEVSEVEMAFFTMRPLPPVQVLKAIDCLEYQLAEPHDWERTTAMQLLRRLRASATNRLPGYADAPWAIADGWRP